MKIIITNIVALNGGDAAILMGMIKALKHKYGNDTKFTVFATEPSVCKSLYPQFNWRETLGLSADRTSFNHIRYFGRIARLARRLKFYAAALLKSQNIPIYKFLINEYDADSLDEYSECDYIVSTGGTYLIEPYGITTQYIDYRISLLLGKPLVFYTQSMGPFHKTQTKNRLLKIFNRSHTILLRDKQSEKNVKMLGISNESILHVVPDAAFALGDIEKLLSRNGDSMYKYGNAAISVREWQYCANKNAMHNYRCCIAEITMKLIDNGYRVHFISTCQGLPAYTDDNIEVSKIMQMIPASYHDCIRTYKEHLPLSRITSMLVTMDFVVSTRLHMCILSLISGTPVFPIAYEFKISELFYSLGYDHVYDMETLDPASICKSVIDFIECYSPEKRQCINEHICSLIKGCKNVPDLFDISAKFHNPITLL